MPEDLARLLLQNLRAKLTWLNLETTLGAFSIKSQHPLINKGAAGKLVPFFGNNRDFVERWELRSGRTNPHRIVLRSPNDHSDEFVMQCASVVIGGMARSETPPRVMYISTAGQNTAFNNLGLENIRGDDTVLVVRFNGKTNTQDEDLLTVILGAAQHLRILFIVGQDATAEPLLHLLAEEPSVTYDDLPHSVAADRREREQMIDRCARLVLQSVQVELVSGGGLLPLHDVYLRHPQILINPLHWVMLLEADDLDADISDTFEVIQCLQEAVSHIADWPVSDRKRLVDGTPMSLGSLLRPADEVLLRYPKHLEKWKREAFHDWLVASWQTPYSINTRDPDAIAPATLIEWEHQCFDLAVALAHEINGTEARALNQEMQTAAHAIDDAAFFLRHQTIAKMRTGCAEPADWAELVPVRWPHKFFPMPSALHQTLKQQNRYFWVQSDFLDRAGVVMSGKEAMQRVEARAERHARRIGWLIDVIPHLPRGWQASTRAVVDLICSRQVDAIWQDDLRRRDIWNSLYSLLSNATPVSAIFYEAFEGRTALDAKELRKRLKVQGPGPMFGIIRSKRHKHAQSAFRLIEPQHSSWSANLFLAADHMALLGEIAKHPGHVKSINQLFKDVEAFAHDLQRMRPDEGTQLSANILDNVLGALAQPSRIFMEGVLDDKFNPSNANKYGLIGWDTMRGLGLDWLMLLLDGAEKLRSTLLPLAYFDGYHLLSLIYESRNEAKTVAPKYDDVRELHKLLEIFLLGFEGLVVQLQWCLQAAGRPELAAAIPNIALLGPERPAERLIGMDFALRVRGSLGDYEVFTLGHPGEKAVSQLGYSNDGLDLIYLQDPTTKNSSAVPQVATA
jgi:hypothetical protein